MQNINERTGQEYPCSISYDNSHNHMSTQKGYDLLFVKAVQENSAYHTRARLS